MSEANWFVLLAQNAQAFGRPYANGFLVRKGSTAMREGLPRLKRDRKESDRLVRQAVIVPDNEPELHRFSHDHHCGSPSVAKCIVKNTKGASLRRDFGLVDKSSP